MEEQNAKALRQIELAADKLDGAANHNPYSVERCAARVLYRLRDTLRWGSAYLPALEGEVEQLRQATLEAYKRGEEG